MKRLFMVSQLVWGLSACPTAPPIVDNAPQNPEPVVPSEFFASPSTEPLVITSQTKDPNLPEILFPGLELKVIAGTGEAGYRDGTALDAQFNGPAGLTINEAQEIFISEVKNNCVRKLDLTNRTLESILCQNDDPDYQYIQGPSVIKYHNNSLFISDQKTLYNFKIKNRILIPLITQFDFEQKIDFFKSAKRFEHRIYDIVIDGEYILFTLGNTIQRMNLTTYHIERLAGQSTETNIDYANPYEYYMNGPALDAKFNLPSSLSVFSLKKVLISDSGNQCIRLLDFSTKPPTVSTLAGKEAGNNFSSLKGGFKDGPLNQALFNMPGRLIEGPKNSIWILDGINHALRVIYDGQVITTIKNINAGGILFSKEKLYLTDVYFHRIYEMDLSQFDFEQLTPQILENEFRLRGN